jgi:cytochrome b pre-mRNA-processing protein 3
LGLFGKLFRRDDADATLPLYNGIVARAREEHWYVQGEVPDTVDGRFDMVAAVLSLVLVRLEDDPVNGPAPAARLAERFVDDMDQQLRQIGIGDMVVGRHVGNMMSMLGGRLGAYRDGLAEGNIDGAITRNLFRGQRPADGALDHVRRELLAFHGRLKATSVSHLIEGHLP